MINTESVETFINQPFERLAGVYFENLADLHIFRDHWKFINYINYSIRKKRENIKILF